MVNHQFSPPFMVGIFLHFSNHRRVANLRLDVGYVDDHDSCSS